MRFVRFNEPSAGASSPRDVPAFYVSGVPFALAIRVSRARSARLRLSMESGRAVLVARPLGLHSIYSFPFFVVTFFRASICAMNASANDVEALHSGHGLRGCWSFSTFP